MRIKNFEFGVSKPLGFRFEYIRSSCDCTTIDFGPFYFTILRKECAENKDICTDE
jgi:hypothetical protein